jgi:dolichyl-diphosphooligosaccharide--protein glycosyltransferase
MEYGFELNEFDPFFNYRATEFIVENGLPAYLEWNDDLSWHPYGRDVSSDSQVMLHTSTATLYQIFGMGSSLYDFTIMFPVVVSSLTTIVIFALVRTIGGTTAGLLASLFFAVSPIIIMRGTLGWFKSEPLGLFYGLLAVYLLISAIKSDKGKVSAAKIVGAGIFLAFGLASWGGVQFFILPIGLFFIVLPFLRKDNRFLIWTSIIFASVFFLITSLFEKTGISFISSLNGFFLIGCTGFLIISAMIKKLGKTQLRNLFVLLGGSVVAGVVIVSSNLINLPSFRYLNAANPFLITTDLLTDSVSEHATTTIDISFYMMSVLMIFAGIGAWLIFQKKVNNSLNIKYEMAAFALIIGFLGIYFSSAFVRLEVLGSISIMILAALGISILVSKILKGEHTRIGPVTKISFLVIIVALLVTPMVYPEKLNWSNHNAGAPIVILNSGSGFDIATNDWSDAMQWVKGNTPQGAVVAAWWDYGYWINTLSERKTLADNATILDWQIRKIAATYMSTPDDAWRILTSDTGTDVRTHYVTLPDDPNHPTRHADGPVTYCIGEFCSTDENDVLFKEFRVWKGCFGADGVRTTEPWTDETGEVHMCFGDDPRYDQPEFSGNIPEIGDEYATLFEYWKSEVYVIQPVLTGLDADYIIVNLVAEKLSDENVLDLYTMKQKGGDETKAFWFMKIADLEVLDYYNRDLQSYTDKFWNETLIGHLIPFTPIAYVDPSNTELQSKTFKKGYLALYVKDVKFPKNGDGPFELVYVPPSFEKDTSGPLTGPIIYKINKDYNPNQ